MTHKKKDKNFHCHDINKKKRRKKAKQRRKGNKLRKNDAYSVKSDKYCNILDNTNLLNSCTISVFFLSQMGCYRQSTQWYLIRYFHNTFNETTSPFNIERKNKVQMGMVRGEEIASLHPPVGPRFVRTLISSIPPIPIERNH